ncbi:MAG: YceK/YidQ family lipoprotein [Nitrosomonas sp.]|uniref:YceK/YidQ family lipoprotein n=1 Tax=Nitrosomonas sp. TaxID=42353 RepID=UPI0025D97C29|nr:YceK/YidQ family lipoprotein [Nitrosomonas sp.]MBY0475690.1 YceK/YidQ family lipoprotein [Nitrosomonas sp.]
MKKKLWFMLIFVMIFLFIGCGTINTVVRDDSVARRDLSRVSSPCATIPRVYSGVAYNICTLRGKPSRTSLWIGGVPELMLVDIVLSSALDTVILPYTIYEQALEGNLELE